MAGGDPARREAILDWPLEDLLWAYLARLRQTAREHYHVSLLAWAATAPHVKKPPKPPEPPDILR